MLTSNFPGEYNSYMASDVATLPDAFTEATEAVEKSSRGKRSGKQPPPPKNRAGIQISVYVNPDIRRVVDDYIRDSIPRTSLTAVVEWALRRLMEEEGRWPPPAST